MAHQSVKSRSHGLQAWDVEGFCLRLRQAMGERSAYALERDTGIAQSLIRKYLSGSSLPGADKLVVLASALGVSVGWLAAGEGSLPGEEAENRSLHVPEGTPSGVCQQGREYRPGNDAGQVPTVVYARIMEPLLALTDDEAQREWVLQRAINIIRALTQDRPALMEALNRNDLEKAVSLAVTVHAASDS